MTPIVDVNRYGDGTLQEKETPNGEKLLPNPAKVNSIPPKKDNVCLITLSFIFELSL